MQVNEISQHRPRAGIISRIQRRLRHLSPQIPPRSDGHIDDRASGVAALAEESFLAGFHVREVVGDEEEFYCCFVRVFDDDLQLTLLRDAVAAAWGCFGGAGAAFLFLEEASAGLGVGCGGVGAGEGVCAAFLWS